MAAEADIDLYDTIEDDYTHEQEENLLNGAGNDNDAAGDLYDDVITSASRTEKESGESTEARAEDSTSETATADSSSTPAAGDTPKYTRRWSVYVSNLTWWTTDVDLMQACNALGVNDVMDIKFYENRANGQSKGFATVSVKSPDSMNKLMEKIKSVQIHSQTPNVHYCNRQNLLMLDAATGGNRYEQEQERMAQYQHQNGARFGPPPRLGRPQFPPGQPGGMPPRPGMGMGPGMLGPRPGMPGMPMGQMMPGRPPFPNPMQPRPGMPGMMPPAMNLQGPPRGAMPPGFPPQGQPNGFPPGMQPPGMGPGMMPGPAPPTTGAPAPHVNPAFFPGGQPPTSAAGAPLMLDQFGRPIDGSLGQPPPAVVPMENSNGPSISDDEFQEILTRNKSVSSSAISRAVQDASQGDFASAIETLVTAISLIKQSKISSDDRCKILIASLQDTKQGIEDKSYGGGSGSSSRDRRRDRSRSRDRDRRRERSRSRDRDRRDYRERSRERDRPMERERGGGGYYQERSRDRYY